MDQPINNPITKSAIIKHSFPSSQSLLNKSVSTYIAKFNLIYPFLLVSVFFSLLNFFISKNFLAPLKLEAIGIYFLLTIILMIISIYVYAINTIGIILIARDETQKSFEELFREVNGFILKYLAISIWVGLKTFLWALLLIIPGIIYAFLYSLSYFALLIEGRESKDALQRSKELIQANIGEVIVKYFYLFLITIIGLVLIAVLGIASLKQSNIFIYFIFQAIFSVFGQISLIYLLFFYKELILSYFIGNPNSST